MADFNHGNIANFTLGVNDLSDWTTSASFDGSREIRDVRPIGGNAVSRVVGPYMATINLEGAYDKALDAILSPIFLAATPAATTFDFEPSGTGGANRSFTGSALMATYRVDASGSDVGTWRATFAVVGTIANA